MPALPKILRKGVVYLYRTREEAESNSTFGGTAAIIGKKADGTGLSISYLVSNRHVVYEGAASVVRINRLDGGKPDIFETEPDEWLPHPKGDDLVIRPATDFIDTKQHDFGYNPFEKIIDTKSLEIGDVDVGDEVFMVGRFVSLQGTSQNAPTLRFGNISSPPVSVLHPIYRRHQLSFAVEMQSRSGFSGSPVFVYWSGASNFVDRSSGKKGFVGMLGINWGYIVDDQGDNTWLNGVIPGWKVAELFDIEQIKNHHTKKTNDFREAIQVLALLAPEHLPPSEC